MKDINEIFADIIQENSSIDMADAEFHRMLVDDPDLRKTYREYCKEIGCSEKRGFLDFAEEYMELQNDVWNNLNDFDNQE